MRYAPDFAPKRYTIAAFRRAIQLSQGAPRTLAKHDGINRRTVARDVDRGINANGRASAIGVNARRAILTRLPYEMGRDNTATRALHGQRHKLRAGDRARLA